MLKRISDFQQAGAGIFLDYRKVSWEKEFFLFFKINQYILSDVMARCWCLKEAIQKGKRKLVRGFFRCHRHGHGHRHRHRSLVNPTSNNDRRVRLKYSQVCTNKLDKPDTFVSLAVSRPGATIWREGAQDHGIRYSPSRAHESGINRRRKPSCRGNFGGWKMGDLGGGAGGSYNHRIPHFPTNCRVFPFFS